MENLNIPTIITGMNFYSKIFPKKTLAQMASLINFSKQLEK